jgi:hypothetical protein
VNLQGIDRLQSLLARVEANAKRPRTRTQGFGIYREFQALTPTGAAPMSHSAPVVTAPMLPPAPVVAAPISRSVPVVTHSAPVVAAPVSPAAPVVAAPAPVAKRVVESVPPESLPAEELLDIDISVSEPPPPVASAATERVALQDLAASKLELDELPIEDVSAEELGAEEISVEIASEVMLDAPESQPSPAAMIAGSVAPKTYTAPPSLDELTFSEPPPAMPSLPLAKEALIEPPPSSAAHAIFDTPDSIDAAIMAATKAQADPAEAEIRAVTPPPESGPQVAVPAMPAAHVPTAASADRGIAPTVEQLGDMVELEPPSLVPLELAERRSSEARKEADQAGAEELEFVPSVSEPSLKSSARDPLQTLVGGFTEEAGSEPSTSVGKPRLEPAAVAPEAKPARPTDFADEAPTASSPLAPESVARPVSARQPAVFDVVSAARGYRPRSFAELLDASIGLLK